MKLKLISLLILTIFTFSLISLPASAGSGVSVKVESASGKTGETVEVDVILSGNTGFSNLGIEIGYDASALTLTNATPNASTGATFTKAQAYTVNPYNMSWDSAVNTTFNGTLVTLTFKIVAEKNGTYPITVDYYKGRNGNYVDGNNVNYDENFNPLGLTYEKGMVTVTGNDEPSGDEPVVSVGNTQGEPGATIEVPVILSGNKGFSNLGLEIDYDESALTLTNATPNASTGATFTKAQAYTVNPYNMSWDSALNTTFNGTLVTLTFKISENAKGTYPVTVDFYKGRNGNYVDGNNVNYDENFAPLGLNYRNGSVTVAYAVRTITFDGEGNVTLTGDTSEGKIYAALYEGDVLKELNIYPAAKTITVGFDLDKSGDTVKIMWWNDKLKPLCRNKEAAIK